MYTYQKYKWECYSIKGSGNMRLKCKEKQKTLTSICRWLDCSKKPATWRKVAKPTRNSNFPICKQIQDSSCFIFNSLYSLRKLNGKYDKKQGYIYPFMFLAKIVTTEIWPSGVLNYSNKKVIEQSLHWVTFLSCYSTIFSSQV